MNEQQIELVKLDRTIVKEETFMSPSFSKIGTGKFRLPPYFPIQSAINWAWLKWQAKTDFDRISDQLSAVLDGTLTPERIADADERGKRDKFDWFVLVAAILSGRLGILRKVAEQTKYSLPGGYYCQALAGLIRARATGDAGREREQYDIVCTRKNFEDFPSPAKPLLRAFVDRNYSALEKEVVKGAKKHWTDRFMGKPSIPVLIKDEPDDIVLNIANKYSSFLWPYVEAAFAKLAILDGAVIKYDDLWFPLKFISTWIDSGAT